MGERVKTHLIVTNQWDEYEVRWVRRLIDTSPLFNSHGTLTFIITGGNGGREEIETFDLNYVAQRAKACTGARGRGSVTIDKSQIYLKEAKGEVLIGVVTHKHIRQYSPMYDEL